MKELYAVFIGSGIDGITRFGLDDHKQIPPLISRLFLTVGFYRGFLLCVTATYSGLFITERL